jgi:hypothetical protein
MGSEKKQRAIDLDRQVRQLVREIDTAWFRVGRLCERCRSERFYEELGYRKFADWINDVVGLSRSRAYVAMRAARELVPIRDADLARMTVQNADLLSRVPKSKQTSLVPAAQTLTEREFRETIAAEVPGLHLEEMVHIEFWVPRSLLEVIDRCIEKAKVLNESESRTEAVEAIFAEYDVRHADAEKEREGERQEVTLEMRDWLNRLPSHLPLFRFARRDGCELEAQATEAGEAGAK